MASDQPSEYYSEQTYEAERSEVAYSEQTEQGIEEDDLDDKYPKLGESEEDEEQKAKYREYLQVIKEIEAQNKILESMKERILELCNKDCKTACDEKEIRDTRYCMETENLKLKCLINKAVNLQNYGPHRLWEEIPITTTFDEDNYKPYVNCTSPNKYAPQSTPSDETCTSKTSSQPQLPCICRKCAVKRNRQSHPKPCLPCAQDRDSEESHLREIMCALKKLKIKSPEDKNMLCEIITVLKQKTPKPCKKQFKPLMQDLEEDDHTLIHLKEKVNGMQRAVERINKEICKRQRQNKTDKETKPSVCASEPDAIMECGKISAKQEQIEKLKENYCYLLKEYAKKEAELNQHKSKPEPTLQNPQSDACKESAAEQTELCILRARVNELKEEQMEFKCIMKEQATQLEDYRNKYISAQQKVEEQCVLLEKLNMNNKRIEKQINCEVKEIRDKFQEKLNELLQYPKLLENEQIKVAELTKTKEDLEQKLILICKELSTERAKNAPKETQDLGPQLKQCHEKCEELQKQICQFHQQRDLYCEQLRRTQDDLDTLRSESAKIIARTKERTELIRQQQQECINKLEKELAQCRATACLSISDREAVIREMQGQLNALSFSFDSAQKQIKTLRNHIAHVSNENCYPVKC